MYTLAPESELLSEKRMRCLVLKEMESSCQSKTGGAFMKEIDEMTHPADDAQYFELKDVAYENSEAKRSVGLWRGDIITLKLFVDQIDKP